jgi:uncharacterized RDD family membrane protein YckC
MMMQMKNLYERRQPEYIPALRFRIFAAIIDWFIFGLIFIALTFIFGKKEVVTDSAYVVHMTPAVGFCAFLAWLGLFPIAEGLTGQTVGKRLNNIRVVRVDLTPVSISNSLLRHVFDVIEFGFLFGIIAIIIASSNNYYRRLGDLLAMTMVIKDN